MRAQQFLTAAHCDEGVSRVAVTFDSSYSAPKGTTYWGTYHADPAYDQKQSNPHDITVVVLDKAVRGITPARLPKAGSLDTVDGATTFTWSATAARPSTRAAVPRRSPTPTSAMSQPARSIP